MKKSLTIIAAAVLALASCSENDNFRKDINDNSVSNGAITFASFTEKATRAENSSALYTQSFYTHQESFQVWARKSNQPTQEIFDGTKVNVAPGNAANTYTYTYAPERFWDKLAPKYHFYASAPARTATDAWHWTFNDERIKSETTINAGYFSIENDFTLNEVNLKHEDNGGADHALENVFKNISVSSANSNKDIDLLIAAPTEVTQSYYNVANPNAVNLNFIHILSKLNVTIKTSLGTVTPTDGSADHTYQVKLLAFEIKNVPNVGTFNENPNKLATNDKQIRWTLTTSASNCTNILTGINGLNDQDEVKDDALSVPYNPSEAQKLYIVESLIIPQKINYERVALDGLAHDAENNAAAPYASYQAYQTAKQNAAKLTADQFNALINNGTFKTWANYTPIDGEKDNRIDQATFNSRVSLATKEGTTPYSNYTEFNQSVAPLNQAQFEALINNGAFVDWADYDHTTVEGETDENSIDIDEFNRRVAEATKEGTTPYSDFAEFALAKAPLTQDQFNALIDDVAFVSWDYYNNHPIVPGETDDRINETEFIARIHEATATVVSYIPAYNVPSEPYFTIKYSIDNEIFTASYNLAAAFLNYNNNGQRLDDNGNLQPLATTGATKDPTTFDFYEGWQNTLNITIHPTAITFTADVAEWATNENVDYKIDNGNE